MKLTVERAALLKALSGLTRVVEKRNTIPILSHVLLRASGDELSVKTTDLDIEASSRVPCTADAEGEITVPAHILHDIARKLPDGSQIALEAIDGDLRVTAKTGRSRFVLQAMPAADYPDLAVGEFSHSFRLAGQVLARMIARTEFAISTEETRFYLNGIYLHTVQAGSLTKLRAVTTDGHRLARIEIDAPDGTDGMPGIIIPRKAVGEIRRMAEEAGEETLAVDVSQHKIRVTAGTGVLTSKLIDGSFPDYQRVIPQGNDKLAVLDSATLKAAIDRVSSVSSERGRAIKLAFEDGSLRLAVHSPDNGEASDEVDADYDSDPLSIGFNAKYALAILDALACDTVAIKLADPGSPTIFAPHSDHSLLCVLMPMRV